MSDSLIYFLIDTYYTFSMFDFLIVMYYILSLGNPMFSFQFDTYNIIFLWVILNLTF